MLFYNGNGFSYEDRLVVFKGRILFDFDHEDEVLSIRLSWEEIDEFFMAGPEKEFWCYPSDFGGSGFSFKKKDMLNLRLRCGD